MTSPSKVASTPVHKSTRAHTHSRTHTLSRTHAHTHQDSPINIGRGRLLPTTSWEAVWQGVLQWFGVPDNDMATVLPNAQNFNKDQLFTQAQLFK